MSKQLCIFFQLPCHSVSMLTSTGMLTSWQESDFRITGRFEMVIYAKHWCSLCWWHQQCKTCVCHVALMQCWFYWFCVMRNLVCPHYGSFWRFQTVYAAWQHNWYVYHYIPSGNAPYLSASPNLFVTTSIQYTTLSYLMNDCWGYALRNARLLIENSTVYRGKVFHIQRVIFAKQIQHDIKFSFQSTWWVSQLHRYLKKMKTAVYVDDMELWTYLWTQLTHWPLGNLNKTLDLSFSHGF